MLNFELLRSEIDSNNSLNSFLNPYSYIVIRREKLAIDNWYVDGQLSVLLFTLLGFKVSRISFDMTSLAPIVFERCLDLNQKIAFIGSRPEEIKLAVNNIQMLYKDINIVYSRDGYFTTNDEMISSLHEVKDSKADIVVVGMGAGLQESYLIELKKIGWQGMGYTCGGFFHQTASSGAGGSYYPRWINKFHLRWLYRIYDEPKLFKRYAKYYPLFIFFIIKDFIKYRIEFHNKRE